jgi:hypothetical protein
LTFFEPFRACLASKFAKSVNMSKIILLQKRWVLINANFDADFEPAGISEKSSPKKSNRPKTFERSYKTEKLIFVGSYEPKNIYL